MGWFNDIQVGGCLRVMSRWILMAKRDECCRRRIRNVPLCK